MGDVRAGDDIFFTRSMAEVLEKQGFFEDALMIYKILADSTPEDGEIEARIKALKSLAARRRSRKGAFRVG